MKSLSVKLQYSASFLFALQVSLLLYSIEATENKKIPALFAFGDSILDTGNNNNLETVSKCNFPPYGRDFPGGIPTGRFGNGKVFSDLMAQGLGIKDVLPAYLDPKLQNKDLPTGVCFASGGSGLDDLTCKIQNVSTVSDELYKFKEYLRKLHRLVGAAKAKEIISKGLFLISSGNNDLGINYYGLHLRALQFDIEPYTSLLVRWSSTFIKDLYDLGARRFGVLSTVPLGCLPAVRTVIGGLLRPCSDNVAEGAKLFNSKLESEVNHLNSTLTGARLVFLDVYNPLLDITQNPQKYGFEVAANGCCGTGAFEASYLCNQLSPFTCTNTSTYVFWDAAHPSERAYRLVVPQVLSKYRDKF